MNTLNKLLKCTRYANKASSYLPDDVNLPTLRTNVSELMKIFVDRLMKRQDNKVILTDDLGTVYEIRKNNDQFISGIEFHDIDYLDGYKTLGKYHGQFGYTKFLYEGEGYLIFVNLGNLTLIENRIKEIDQFLSLSEKDFKTKHALKDKTGLEEVSQSIYEIMRKTKAFEERFLDFYLAGTHHYTGEYYKMYIACHTETLRIDWMAVHHLERELNAHRNILNNVAKRMRQHLTDKVEDGGNHVSV